MALDDLFILLTLVAFQLLALGLGAASVEWFEQRRKRQ